jgi:putative transposase
MLLGGAGRSGLHYSSNKTSALAAEVTLPLPRSLPRTTVFFITAQTFEKRFYLQSHRMCRLLVDVLLNYRRKKEYLLHEFVIMPNHFHLLLTPMRTLERAMQCLKGGFSYRVRRETNFSSTFWQTSFYDRRVRDATEYSQFKRYIYMNPVKKNLVVRPEEWEWSSACGRFSMDEVPRRLKPEIV